MIKFKFITPIKRRGWTKKIKVTPTKEERIYLDGRFAFMLYFKDNYQAVVAFDVVNQGVIIKQIQGTTKGSKEYDLPKMIMPFYEYDYRRMLIKKVKEFAKKNQLETIKIVSTEKSKWLKSPKNKEKLQNQVEYSQLDKNYNQLKKYVSNN